MSEVTFHPVASAAEVAEGEMKQVSVGKRSFALYRLGGRFYATDAFCTHGHALLTEGYIEGELVECPMHGGTFEIASGKPVGQPCVEPLIVYPVKLEQDQVSIGIRDGAAS
jgi:naphthalene 1,2-dioxygenase system ferredoxin subunit